MIKEVFQADHSGELKKFLETQCGIALIEALRESRPSFSSNAVPHLHIEGNGVIRGYELCTKTLLSLAEPPVKPEFVEQDYGVKKPKPEKE